MLFALKFHKENQRSNVIIIARKEGGAWERIINPRRACAEGYSSCLVCVCVCLSVCLSVCMYNERWHRVKRQICGNIKKAFFLKLSCSKVRASFTYLGRGGHH